MATLYFVTNTKKNKKNLHAKTTKTKHIHNISLPSQNTSKLANKFIIYRQKTANIKLKT
jgi:hypothetical protein